MNTRSICQSLTLFAFIVLNWHEQALCQSSCPDPNSYTISCISGNCNSSDEGCSYNIRFTSSFTGNNKYAFITIRYEGTVIHTECVGPLPGGTTSSRVTVNNIDCNATTSQLGGTWTAYTHSHRNNPCNGNICRQGYCSAGTCATGILPIELGSFMVRQVQNGAMIYWTTLSENNNELFKIQRSHNAEDWKTIGTQSGSIFSDMGIFRLSADFRLFGPARGHS